MFAKPSLFKCSQAAFDCDDFINRLTKTFDFVSVLMLRMAGGFDFGDVDLPTLPSSNETVTTAGALRLNSTLTLTQGSLAGSAMLGWRTTPRWGSLNPLCRDSFPPLTFT